MCDFRKIKIAALASRTGFLKQHYCIRGRMIFVVEERDGLVHPRKFSRAPKFYSPNASSTSSPAMTTRNVSKYFQISPEVQNGPIENHWSREKMIAYSTKWIICTFSHPIYKIFISLWSDYDWSAASFNVYILC